MERSSKEMREKCAEKTKIVQRHRQELCEYLNSSSRLKDKEICQKVDSLCLEFKLLGKLEQTIEYKEWIERKELKGEKIA